MWTVDDLLSTAPVKSTQSRPKPTIDSSLISPLWSNASGSCFNSGCVWGIIFNRPIKVPPPFPFKCKLPNYLEKDSSSFKNMELFFINISKKENRLKSVSIHPCIQFPIWPFHPRLGRVHVWVHSYWTRLSSALPSPSTPALLPSLDFTTFINGTRWAAILFLLKTWRGSTPPPQLSWSFSVPPKLLLWQE